MDIFYKKAKFWSVTREFMKKKGFFELWEQFQEEGYNGLDYPDLANWQEKFKPYGLTFDYGLDAEPFDFEIN